MTVSRKQRGAAPGGGGRAAEHAGAQRFCTACGSELVDAARFCVECGQPLAGRPPRRRDIAGLERLAPLLIFGTVVALGASAVVLGMRSAAPPAVVPPRDAPPAGNEPLPEGHPPVSIPDDVRSALDRMAAQAKQKPDDVDMWKQLGFAQYRAGQVDRTYLAPAAESYEHVLSLQPTDLDALRTLGNIAYDRENTDAAIRYYQRYLEQKPDDAFVLTDLGTMFLSANNVARAIATYEEVLATDPKFFQAQFNLAIAYRQSGDTAKALDALRKSQEMAPDEETKKRVQDLLSRIGAPSAPAEAPAGGGATTLRAGVEAIFRSHPIVGPKLDRIEWPEDNSAKVILRDFPMDGMPPQMRERFVDRIRSGLRDQKKSHSVDGSLRVELVDGGSGRIMETVVE
jgi:Flp pilus assembly protein TadD